MFSFVPLLIFLLLMQLSIAGMRIHYAIGWLTVLVLTVSIR